MKSKIFVSLLLIVAMLFTFVACEQPQGGCNQHVDQNNDGKCDLCQVTIEQSGNGSGNGNGSGDGSGTGNGSGNGSSSGDGNGSGEGNGSGDGSGTGSGTGDGNGSGNGSGSGSGEGNGSGDGSGTGSGTGSGSGDGSGDGNGSGDIPTGGEQVTAEVWAQQLDLDNHTNIAVVMATSYEFSDKLVEEIAQQEIVDNKYHIKQYVTQDGEQGYLHEEWYNFLDDGSCVTYSKLDGSEEISAETSQDVTKDSLVYWVLIREVIVNILKDSFANATFDQQTKKYTYVQTSAVECMGGGFVLNSATCVVEFVNNKLVTVDVQAVGPGAYNIDCDWHIAVNVGSSEIILPTVN